MKRRVASAALVVAYALSGDATAAAAAATPSAVSGFAQVAGSLLLIVGVIIALAWVANRLRLTPRAASSGLRILADVAVGAKERVVLLQVGDAQALVGVSADGVRPLVLLDRAVQLPETPSVAGPFADRLKALMARGGTA